LGIELGLDQLNLEDESTHMRVFERLEHHAQSRGKHAAIVTENFSASYHDLLQLVVRSRLALETSGFNASDVVGITLDNEVEHLIASLAVMAIGASQINLATHDPNELRIHLAERAGVSKVISEFERAWFGRESPSHRFIERGTSAFVYFRTSGTTGELNIVPLSEHQIALQAKRHADYKSERLLRLASIEHNNSKRHRLYCVWAGGTNIFRPRASFDLIDFVLRHDVTCLDISRMHASDIATMEGAHQLSVLKIRTGGTAIPYGVRKSIEDNVTRRLYVRYGTTECGSISMARPGDHDEAETAGHILDDVELEIVDDLGSRTKIGESGQIRLRAPGIATSYLDSPNDTAKKFRDGWFYPGDMGCIREDGALIVQGRTDDMFILNGVNMFPAEIERILEAHPSVSCAAAVGIPSEVHGHIPVAVVELKKKGITSSAELKHFARAALGLRAPRRILVVSNMPRNSQGKITKQALLPLFASRAF
jgi:acyl-coenzyme A synthetase/AMP-(fatty) acid ligase